MALMVVEFSREMGVPGLYLFLVIEVSGELPSIVYHSMALSVALNKVT